MSRLVFCFHWSDSFLSRLIRWQTRGRYSHMSVILRDGRHVEAREFKGVVVHPIFTTKSGEFVDQFVLPNLTPEQEDEIERFLLLQEGLGYDYLAALCFVTRCHPGRESATRWFCSELPFQSLLRVNYHLLRDTQAFEVSPSMASKSPFFKNK